MEHESKRVLVDVVRLGPHQQRIEQRIAGLQTDIASYNAILADEAVLRGVIKDDLKAIREEFATKRRCEITLDGGEMDLATRNGLLAYLRGGTFGDTRVRETLSLAIASEAFQWY